jgi:hypothetical protein
MSGRERLRNRRHHDVRAFKFRGVDYTVGYSRFADGALAEIFLDNHKTTSDMASDARDAAVGLSIALQYGVPPEAIRDAVTRDSDGEASGIIGCVLDLLLGREAPTP